MLFYPTPAPGREFLRKMAIGKQVRFKVDYAVPSIKRQWATVKIGQLDLGAEMVKQGWAAVKDPASSRDGCSPNVEDYLRLEDAAQAERLGMWGEKNAKTNEIRAREQTIDDAEAFVASVKDQPLPAVVEWVRDGTTCKCYIPSKNVSVLVQSAGIQAPKMRPRRTAANGGGAAAVAAPAPPASPSTDAADGDAAPSSPQAPAPEPILPPEPFAAEAKHFLEVRMLHRDICVRLHSADRNNSFFGTLEHPNGDIRALMVRQGLARVVDWSIEYLPRDKKLQLRECEQLAKTAKARLWNSYVAPDLSGGGPAQFVGTVGEVSSGDTLVILAGGEDAAGNEAGAPPAPGARDARRISLSSVRVPRMGGRNATPEPYALQSKEFLRKMLIGKRVRVSVEYSRASPARADGDQRPALPARYFASVFLERGGNSKNVAEALLLAGLGEAVRHRSGDERSAHYDALLDAQAAAKARAKGIHSSSEGGEATQRIKDVTGGRGAGGVSATAAQQFVKMLKTGKTHKAIVEYIHNAGRFKLYIPKENCRINFQLAGLRVPATPRRALAASSDGRAGREATPGEPFGLEALAYVRENVMQRSVEVEIEDVNRSGCAIGVLR
jgi:staphylococcal nuclease domain-containing protein 1